MAWEWSHAHKAYAAAYANLHSMAIEDLRVIWAEWRAACVGHSDDEPEANFCARCYAAALAEAQTIESAETLADDIWSRASGLATCDNGGFNAWVCPYGCGCHLVSFDREEANDDER